MIRLSRTGSRSVSVAVAVALSCSWAAATYAQRADRASLFERADMALKRAQEARAEILAPRSFARGMERYQEAGRDFERGRSAEQVEKKLEAATAFFEQASEAARAANAILSAALAARDDAEAADAPSLAPGLWARADERFESAARKHEDGDVGAAGRRAQEAESLYRNAELEAIKSEYLQETWDVLSQARESEVEKRAPRTLARADSLVGEAARLLSERRYETDEPRRLARQARSEALHAIYLATIIRAVEKGEMSFEDVMLARERELARIAAALEITPHFQEGMAETSRAIVERIGVYQDSLARFANDLREREAAIRDLEERLAAAAARTEELESKMSGLEEERTALLARMEDQARLRQRFTAIERMFSGDEARVFREGGDVIVRLFGLTFPTGGAEIAPRYYDLLDRVQRAILEFPGARVSVEGHTDSVGGERTNLKLSQERAEAVRAYLLGNPALQPSLIEAVGYGESRPVASNDSEAGRAQNRRTDIVIHTGLGIGY